jgi:hypothetical protein
MGICKKDIKHPRPQSTEVRLFLLPLRLMTSLLKRSDIRSPPWLVALTAVGKPSVREGEGAKQDTSLGQPHTLFFIFGFLGQGLTRLDLNFLILLPQLKC